MITCPKCGFLQPKDRFCANCGVDMEKYQSRHQAPRWQRLLGSYFLQASVILVIVIGTSVAIYRKKKADIERQLNVVSQPAPVETPKKAQPASAPIKVAKSPTPSPAPEEKESLAPTPAPATPHHAEPVAVENKLSPASPEHTSAPESRGLTKGSIGTPAAPTFRLVLAEASMTFLNRMGETRPLSGQGTINAGVVPALESRLQAGRTSQEVRLLDEERLPAQIGANTSYTKTSTDEVLNIPIGFEVSLRPSSIDERGLHFTLTLTRTLRESPTSATPPLVQRYIENVTLANQAGVFVHGFLPHRRPFPGVENILPEALQYVMNSPEFLNGAFDLVLFIEGIGLPESPAR